MDRTSDSRPIRMLTFVDEATRECLATWRCGARYGREVLTGNLSKRAAIAKYGVGWHTLKKMLAHDEPPGYRPPV